MNGWMDGTGTRKTLFHWKVCMKPISGGKTLYNFYFFLKRAGMGNPFTRSTRHLKAREEDVTKEHNNQDTTNIRTKGGCFTPHVAFTIYIKTYLNAKAELWKIKYLSMQKYNNLQKKKPSKRN
jgi:hypothetical protein